MDRWSSPLTCLRVDEVCGRTRLVVRDAMLDTIRGSEFGSFAECEKVGDRSSKKFLKLECCFWDIVLLSDCSIVSRKETQTAMCTLRGPGFPIFMLWFHSAALTVYISVKATMWVWIVSASILFDLASADVMVARTRRIPCLRSIDLLCMGVKSPLHLFALVTVRLVCCQSSIHVSNVSHETICSTMELPVHAHAAPRCITMMSTRF